MRIIYFSTFLFFFTQFIYSQNPDQATLDKIVEEDSLVKDKEFSNFIIRIDYYNKTLSSGRDLGVEQYSLAPSLTYNHKSGISASLTGSYYSIDEPHYNMTDANINYSNFFKFNDNWAYSLSYDHYFYHPDSASVLTNNLGLSTSYSVGKFSANLSYGHSFGGNEIGNSLSPGISGFFIIRNVGFIDKIEFLPSISASFGTSNITFRKFNATHFQNGQGYSYSNSKLLKGTAYAILLKDYKGYKTNNPQSTLTFNQYLFDVGLVIGYKKYVETHPGTTVTQSQYDAAVIAKLKQAPTTSTEEFGLLSWNFSIPVRLKIGRYTLGVTYNYIIPHLLPHETYDNLPNQSYFSAMMSYKISK